MTSARRTNVPKRAFRLFAPYEFLRLRHRKAPIYSVLFLSLRCDSHLLLTRFCDLRDFRTQNRCPKTRYSVTTFLSNPSASATEKHRIKSVLFLSLRCDSHLSLTRFCDLRDFRTQNKCPKTRFPSLRSLRIPPPPHNLLFGCFYFA